MTIFDKLKESISEASVVPTKLDSSEAWFWSKVYVPFIKKGGFSSKDSPKSVFMSVKSKLANYLSNNL